MKFLGLSLLFFSLMAEARVFSMKDGQFAGYIHGTYGPSSVDTSFFEGESTSTDYSEGFVTHMGGEFGFLYRTDHFNWIFGFEIIKPTKTSGEASAGGSTDYSYTSELTVFAPKLGLEVIVYQTQKFRLGFNGTIGTASLTTKTEYTNVTIAPNADFTVKGKSAGNMLTLGIGGEWHFSDNTTFYLQGNYRNLRFDKIKYSEDVSDSFQGPQTSGGTMTELDGSRRKLNLTGIYAAAGFRFWLF